MLKQIEGSQAVAEAVALSRPEVISAYPITPQTHIVEDLGMMVKSGKLAPCEFLLVESEFGALSACIGSSAAGARSYTATSSQGMLFMMEAVYNASGMGLPIVMTVGNRAIGAPINIWNDWSDSMSARDAGWGLFLIVIIIGGIYGGVFTPTEAAAVAAVYSAFVALFVYRDMGPLKDERWLPENTDKRTRIGFSASVYAVAFYLVWLILSFFFISTTPLSTRSTIGGVLALFILLGYPMLRGPEFGIAGLPMTIARGLPIWGRNLWLIIRKFFPALFHADTHKVMVDSSKTIIMLMFIIVNALLFAHVLTSERIPDAITQWMVSMGFNWFTFLIAVNLLLLLGGQFMEPSGLLLIVAPVVFPIAIQLGIDPIHLGIIMVVNMEIGMITPPIGLNLFVTSGITGMNLVQVVKAAAPFVAVLFLFLILVTYVPIISTWLPTLLMGPEIITH